MGEPEWEPTLHLSKNASSEASWWRVQNVPGDSNAYTFENLGHESAKKYLIAVVRPDVNNKGADLKLTDDKVNEYAHWKIHSAQKLAYVAHQLTGHWANVHGCWDKNGTKTK